MPSVFKWCIGLGQGNRLDLSKVSRDVLDDFSVA